MREYASAEERAAKIQKMTVRHFGFTEKVHIRARFAHCYCGSAVREMPSWECRLRCAIAGGGLPLLVVDKNGI